MILADIILLSIVIMLASLAGVISVWRYLGAFVEKNMRFLVSFSAGVFLIIAYELGHEVLEEATSLGAGFLWIMLGAVGMYVLFLLLPTFHHHHDTKEEEHAHSPLDARRILVSDGIHNIGDGILLASSLALGTMFGIVTAISIFVHELIQEISEFFVLRQAGYTTKRALFINFSTSATILIGSIGAHFLISSFELLKVPLLGIVAGSFLIVIVHDLIPHSIRTSKHHTHYIKHIFWFIVGLLLMLGVTIVVGH